jgi:uncharacterized protein DUF5906
MVRWFAHRVQRPEIKINHALVIIGDPGVGKDTLLEPVKYGIGAHNFGEVSPRQMQGDFNGYLRSVILRVNEVHDLGDINRYHFYEQMKSYLASPPDMLRCNEKYVKEHYILNLVGVIFTSNHKTTGIYLPADDRRHYVLWTPLLITDFSEEYWKDLWDWYDNEGGKAHVAQYLKAPPPKTRAFWDIVGANMAPEDAELADCIDELARDQPDKVRLNAVTIEMVKRKASTEFYKWLADRKNTRNIPHRFEQCGYTAVRNPDNKQGLWSIGSVRQMVFAKKELSLREQIAAAQALINPPKNPRPKIGELDM